jgi:hypothetical protein
MRGTLGFGIALVASSMFCWVQGAQAQEPSAQAIQAQKDAGAVAQMMGESMKGLTQYTYQQKVQMSYKGEVKSTTLNQISFPPGSGGKPQVTEIVQSDASGTQRRLGHRIRDKKEGEVKADVEALTKLAPQYLFPDKAQLEKLAQTAAVSYQGSNIILTVADFVQKGDRMTITANAATRNRISMQASTMSGEDPVTIDATYAELKNGLNYLSHYVVNCPNEGVELTIDTLNFEVPE